VEIQTAFDATLRAEIDTHQSVADQLAESVAPTFGKLCSACAHSFRNGGKILLFGNGGSASDAMHIATEFVVRYLRDRPALPALALVGDSATMTAASNELGYENLFVRQIEAHARRSDVAIAISTSGNSTNVIAGVAAARRAGCVAAAMTGSGGGALAAAADPLLRVPPDDTPRIQELHNLIGHALCEAVETALHGGPS
jgi:D-sedoheptulose 7-phosphate isomerase